MTGRGKDPSGRIPMCGVPWHAADNYIAKIIKAGYKVAICEQMEDPALAKGIVRRDVIRVITAGTYLDEHNSDTRYLLCLSPNGKNVGVAFTDPVSGTIQTNQYPLDSSRIAELIAKLPVYECVYPLGEETEAKVKSIFAHPLLCAKNIALSPYEQWPFNLDIARKTLCEHFTVHNLNGFGIEDLAEAVSSAGALLEYLREMNKQPLKHIDRIALYNDDDYVFISPAAARGLELDTLINTLDHTLTPLGRRMFRFWLTHPLKNVPDIIERQDAVRVLGEHPDVCRQLKDHLDKIPDLEKNISRISCGYTHAKDLLAVRNTLALLPAVRDSIKPILSRNALFDLEDIPDLRQFLERAINEAIPLARPEGKIIRAGYHAELDSLRDIQENGRQWLKKFQEDEIKRTGINSLKVGFNNVFGYYIEITKANQHLAPRDYIRKQTLVNGERYITPALKEYE
ncbi:MAG: DNA mismatch repair protein MutS, partial [Nitrospirota bacterium]